MKSIGLIVAMDKELELFKNKFSLVHENKGLFDFYIGSVDDEHIIIVSKSGIGKVNSALCTMKMIETFNVDFVISSGVCGTLKPNGIIPGDFIIAEEVGYYDVWCGVPNDFGQVQDFPAKFKCIDIDTSKLDNMFNIHKGYVISGDWFVDTKYKAIAIYDSFMNSIGIDMESASIAQTCYRYSKPFVSVRIVSDAVLNDTAATYEEFWMKAPEQLNELVTQIITTNL